MHFTKSSNMAIIHIKLTAEQRMSKSRLWGKTSKTMEVLYGSFMAVFGVFVAIGVLSPTRRVRVSRMRNQLNCSEPDELLRSRLWYFRNFGIRIRYQPLRLRDVCDIQLQSHGNLKRTKSFTPCSSPTETSFPLPSASSFSVQRSKSDPRKYENQKRIIQYLPYLNPEIVIQSRIFRAAHLPDDKQGKRKCHGNRKQPHNDSFCGKASFCSTFLQRNRSAGHKTNA